MSSGKKFAFEASLAQDAKQPIRPMKSVKGGPRPYRIWLDAYLRRGEGDDILDEDGDTASVILVFDGGAMAQRLARGEATSE